MKKNRRFLTNFRIKIHFFIIIINMNKSFLQIYLVASFIYPFIYSFLHVFIHLFICLFVHSFIHFYSTFCSYKGELIIWSAIFPSLVTINDEKKLQTLPTLSVTLPSPPSLADNITDQISMMHCGHQSLGKQKWRTATKKKAKPVIPAVKQLSGNHGS